MNCPRCQHENPSSAKFCGACGVRLEAPCPACGIANPPGNKFCHECGAALAGEQPGGRFASPQVYTPKHLAERILSSRTAIEGERKQVTVLFGDVEDFTGLAERLDPEELHLLMDEVFAILLEVIHRYEGTINQFLGDGVMALFGAPVALEDHALRAIEASLEIQATMAARAEGFQERFGRGPLLRIGLNTGRVVVGKIGDDLRMDYTAQGDTVNLAARLQHVARAGTVVMGPVTHRLVASTIECRPLGTHAVKGKAAPVEVFQAIRSMGRGALLQVGTEERLSSFVDREEEIGLLLEFFDEARGGQPRIVSVVGEAGVGKSRLLLEFRRRIDGAGAPWFVGHCVPYGRSTPYRPVVEILRGVCGLDAADTEEAAGQKVDAVLARLGDDRGQLASVLRAVLALGPADSGLAVLSAADRKAAITRALDEFFERLAGEAPHVIVFENCQWLDSASAEYLMLVTQRLAGGPLMVVLTHRPDETARAMTGAGGERIVLHPLSPSQAQGLVGRLAEGKLPPELVALAVDRAGGNPLFIEEVTRTLVESGAGSVPPTIEAMLRARIDRLPPRPKTILQTASVIGQEFSRALLERVVEDPAGVPGALRELVSLGLTTETDTGDVYRFKQPLLQEVTYEGLLSQRLRVLHRAIGEAIEAMYPHRLFEHLEQLARHFTRAEEWGRAVLYHRDAGRKAANLCANEEAVRRLSRALEMLDRLPESLERTGQAIDVRLDLCPPMLQLGRLDDVSRLAREAESLAQVLGDPARLVQVYSYLSNYHYMKGEPDLATEYGRRCLRLSDETEGRALPQSPRQYLGASYHALGEYPTAQEVLGRHIEALEGGGEFRRVGATNVSYVSSCGWLAFSLCALGEFERAREVAAKAERAAATAGHPYVQAIAATFTGLVWHARGDFARAVTPLKAALDICREHRLTVWRPVPSALLGHSYVALGGTEQGLELLADGASLAERLGIQAYRSLWTAYLADGFLSRGQVPRAMETARSALDLAVRHKEQGNHARALQVLGSVHLRLGASAVAQADECLRQALEEAERLHMRPLVAQCYWLLAQVAREQGDTTRAGTLAETAEAVRAELGMQFWWDKAGRPRDSEATRSTA